MSLFGVESLFMENFGKIQKLIGFAYACGRTYGCVKMDNSSKGTKGSTSTSRILKTVKEVLKTGENTSVELYTDSMINLNRIKGSITRWKPFVAYRIKEIKDCSTVKG